MIKQGIKFNNFHSYDDFQLVLTDVNIEPPEPYTNYVEVPGRDDYIDVSESLGEIRYKPRMCEFKFVSLLEDGISFEMRKSQIANAIHGKVCKIILDADADYYYYGRCSVDSYSQKGNLRQIVVTATVEAYKLKHEKTTVIAKVNGEAVIVCQNERMSYVPTIISDAEMSLVFNGSSYAVGAGTYLLPDMKFVQGDNIITCTGTGTITFTYQEGAL